jgi:hypothetical protein
MMVGNNGIELDMYPALYLYLSTLYIQSIIEASSFNLNLPDIELEQHIKPY